MVIVGDIQLGPPPPPQRLDAHLVLPSRRLARPLLHLPHLQPQLCDLPLRRLHRANAAHRRAGRRVMIVREGEQCSVVRCRAAEPHLRPRLCLLGPLPHARQALLRALKLLGRDCQALLQRHHLKLQRQQAVHAPCGQQQPGGAGCSGAACGGVGGGVAGGGRGGGVRAVAVARGAGLRGRELVDGGLQVGGGWGGREGGHWVLSSASTLRTGSSRAEILPHLVLDWQAGGFVGQQQALQHAEHGLERGGGGWRRRACRRRRSCRSYVLYS